MKSKDLKVKDLIALLQQQDPKALVGVEGCDCEAHCIGLSVKEDGEILLRQERGCYYAELDIIAK